LTKLCFFFHAEDGIRDKLVTGVQTCALPIFTPLSHWRLKGWRGPCAAMGDSCTLTLDEDATVTALVEVHPRLVVTVRNPRVAARSEERRVGKECESRWALYH